MDLAANAIGAIATDATADHQHLIASRLMLQRRAPALALAAAQLLAPALALAAAQLLLLAAAAQLLAAGPDRPSLCYH
eukprot:6475004-Amphidinium_carterae.1